MTYTDGQLAAWKWLPADGSERRCLDSWMHGRLLSFQHVCRGMACERVEMPRHIPVWYLTPAGVAERARLVAEGLIE
jgi:hypothetical protein